MTHSFDIEIAQIVGIEGAIILQNIEFWISKNKANNKNFINGYYWTYNTYEAWQDLFPYMKLNTIKRVLRELAKNDYIVIEQLNKSNYDKTNYYRLTNRYFTIVKKITIVDEKNNYQGLKKSHSLIGTDNKQHIINTDKEKNTKKENGSLKDKINKLKNEEKTETNSKSLDAFYKWLKEHSIIAYNKRNEFDSIFYQLITLYGLETIMEVLEWAMNDNFWQDKLLNAKSIKNNFDKMKMQMLKDKEKNKPNENGVVGFM